MYCVFSAQYTSKTSQIHSSRRGSHKLGASSTLLRSPSLERKLFLSRSVHDLRDEHAIVESDSNNSTPSRACLDQLQHATPTTHYPSIYDPDSSNFIRMFQISCSGSSLPSFHSGLPGSSWNTIGDRSTTSTTTQTTSMR